MPKSEIITFKADKRLRHALQTVPNRSEFIREAIMNALDNVCPVCQGSGTLIGARKEHWNAFVAKHQVTDCEVCNVHLSCKVAKEKRTA